MRIRIRSVLGLAFAASFVALGAPAAYAGSSDVNKDLAAARAATAKYHDVAVAEADGYVSTEECVQSPDGVMGVHYVNFGLFGAPLDVRKPAGLLYQPQANGTFKLTGVEYFKVDEDQDLSTDGDRPSLFGVPFAGPMDGHGPGMPRHYDLHVWVWQHNPSGTFAEWNPAGHC